MARYKAAKGSASSKSNAPAARAQAAIPCLILVVGVFVLIGFLFFAMLTQGGAK
jgi:accessory gene regulator protein AgrB